MAEKETDSGETAPQKTASEKPQKPRKRIPDRRAERRSLLSRLTANWFTMGGSVVIVTAFVIFGFLWVIESLAEEPHGYAGIVFIFLPPVLALGVAMLVFGFWLHTRTRKMERTGIEPTGFMRWFDLRRTESQHRLLLFTAVFSTLFVFTMAVLGFEAYEYTESTSFCGETCHGVMSPQFTAYSVSPHTRVACVECHVGSGANWYVRSKLSGAYQLYAYAMDKYPRPIPTPIHNLRPAQDTCEHCHWPEKFYGGIRKTYAYYQDGYDVPWEIDMLLKIGGGGANGRGPEGIHWHVSEDHLVEYVARDEKRIDIPWVRVTDSDGSTTVYTSADDPPDQAFLDAAEVRRMDCLDCHNRPAHTYGAPVELVNDLLGSGQLPRSAPEVKTLGLQLLAGEYETNPAALEAIQSGVQTYYAEDHSEWARANSGVVDTVTGTLQRAYSNNMFPEMKTRWDGFPDHSSHWFFTGCFRCHAGNLVSESGETVSSSCDTCHAIIGQGRRGDNYESDAEGLPFLHPMEEDYYDEPVMCNDCHDGSLGN